jgi:hypothetical protein
MLNLFPERSTNCESTRRDFMLRVGALGGLGLSLEMLLRAEARGASTGTSAAGDVNCILIWTRGGTSHHDSVDPKPEAKAEVRGDFGVIDTALPGVQFTDQMPQFAKHLKSFTVMRNLNPQNSIHGMAEAVMMSGKKSNASITYPCFGSVLAKEQGARSKLPPFIQIGSHVDRIVGGGTAGYLGIGYNPFELPGDPSKENFTVHDVILRGEVSLARFDRRRQALKVIDRLQRDVEKQPSALKVIDGYYENALSMITSPATQKAFDLKAESSQVRDTYGRTNLGQSCLLARRLIEAGSRFVTVTSGGWDTHVKNFPQLKSLLPPLDRAFPALVADLKERGLLESTLVVWMTDFGRTPVINYGLGRDHWATAGPICFAGAGTPPGAVIGQTDATGSRPVDKEYYPSDVAATIYTKLGIPLDTLYITPDGRPVRVCDGRVIQELMG